MKLRSLLARVALAFLGLLIVACAVAYFFWPADFEVTEAWTVLRRHNLELATQLKDVVVQSDADVAKIGEKRGLPAISIQLSRKDIVHFDDLYRKYEDPDFGIEYYAAHNLWRNAKLTFEGRTYDVKIKSHGRSPTNHRSGRYISLAIKMPRGENIRGSRRFSLLVRDHFVPKKQVVFDVADHFGLLKNQEELIRVQINNWDEKLFFFDRRLNDAFMEVHGRPSMRLFSYSMGIESTIKSSVYTGGPFDEASYRARMQQTLEELEYPESQHEPLIDRFTAFSKMLAEKRYDDLSEFCDMDYLSSFQAFRLVTGLVGHLARKDNLFVFYDLANGKFYPVVTRDCWMEKMQIFENGSAELFVDTAGIWDQPLFWAMSRNLDIRRDAYKKIYEYKQQQGEEVQQRHRNLLERYEKLSYFGWASVGMRQLGVLSDDYTRHNLAALEAYIDYSQTGLKITFDTHKVLLSLVPKSLAGVRVSHFQIPATKKTPPKQLPVVVWGEYEEAGEIQYIPLRQLQVRAAGGKIDLSEAVAHLEFITPLSDASQRVPRVYAILFEFADDEVLPAPGSVEIVLANAITGKSIELRDATVQSAAFDAKDFRKTEVPEESRDWMVGHEHLRLVVDAESVTIPDGEHTVEQDLVLPRGKKLIIQPGARLRLGKDVAIAGYAGIDVNGTEARPVSVVALNASQPFGSVGILGDEATHSNVSYLRIEGGRERWVNGVYFSGGLSIHDNAKVRMHGCVVANNHADDGLNVKYCLDVQITQCEFRDNAADQVDLDFCDGEVSGCRFQIKNRQDANGDGLDLSGSRLVVRGNTFDGFPDKGISVGEQSRVEIRNNQFQQSTAGMAVKDSSQAYLVGNHFHSNHVDVDAFQKKSIFGGGTVWFSEPPSSLSIFLDAKSKAFSAGSLSAFAEALAGEHVANAADEPGWQAVSATITGDPPWRVPLLAPRADQDADASSPNPTEQETQVTP